MQLFCSSCYGALPDVRKSDVVQTKWNLSVKGGTFVDYRKPCKGSKWQRVVKTLHSSCLPKISHAIFNLEYIFYKHITYSWNKTWRRPWWAWSYVFCTLHVLSHHSAISVAEKRFTLNFSYKRQKSITLTRLQVSRYLVLSFICVPS